jgi:crotonobetainyl-CoA hydratase
MAEIAKTTIQDGVLEILFDRPPVNAIDGATSRRLGEVFDQYRRDDRLQCAIITAPGDRIFSAGWDLKAAAQKGENEDEDWGVGGFAGITQMFDLYKPVIAAVNGRAIGGGFEIALGCEIIVAAENADFSLPEALRGVTADAGGLQVLPRRIPMNIAMELLLTGRRMDAAEAHKWGLVNKVVPRAALMDTARAMAREIAQGAPLTLQATKEVVRGVDGMSVREAYRMIKEKRFPVHARMLVSEDHIEGPRAFAEKRKPVWKGR